jgi:hypothetical protein
VSARISGSGAVQPGLPIFKCNGPDALGGAVTTAAHPGRTYPPFDLYTLPPPGGAQGFIYTPASAPVVAATSFDANASFNPTSFFGTANDGGVFGLNSTVNLDNEHTAARWRFDVTPPAPICGVSVSSDGSLPGPDGVYDGHPFNDPGDHSLDSYYRFEIYAGGTMVADGTNLIILPGSFNSWGYIGFPFTMASEWSIVFSALLGGGGFDGFHFFGGLRLTSFSLWTRSLAQEGATAISGSGHRE